MSHQCKGALAFVAVLALAYGIHSVSACVDYSQYSLCLYVLSTRSGTVGHGWSCASELRIKFNA